jgi:RNA polymerase sigma factor (sigma-70 family)
MTTTDADLLASFARHRDETSFRALAQRHFSLIFHTALRRTGSRPLAEEITQNVLCAVARKAAILAHKPGSFPAWLHRSTLFECTTAMRKEAVRQRRMQDLPHPDNHLTDPDDEFARWQQALPHLDLALNKLPEADRRVLLLHFFESLPFPRIAALLGKSPAAVQKQSVRALEKLSRLLRSKNAVVPVALLAAGLTAESAKATPLGLIPAFTAHALSTTTGMSGLSIMIATHQKILIPCSLLLMATPLILQQRAIARAESNLAALPVQVMAVSLPSSGNAPLRSSSVSSSLDLAKLADEAWLGQRSRPVDARLRLKLRALGLPQLITLLASTKDIGIPRSKGKCIAFVLADLISRQDPKAAVTTALAAGWGDKDVQLTGLYIRYINADAAGAGDWLIQQQKNPEFQQPEESTRTESRLGGMQAILLNHLALSSPADACRFFEGITGEHERYTMILQTTSLGAFSWKPTPAWAESYLSLLDRMPADQASGLLTSMIATWAPRDVTLGTSYSELLIAAAAEPDKERIAKIILRMQFGDHSRDEGPIIAKAKDMLERLLPATAEEILSEAVSEAHADRARQQENNIRAAAQREEAQSHLKQNADKP